MDEVEVQVALEEGVAAPVPAERVEALVRHVLAAEGVSAAEISVVLAADERMAELNSAYLGHVGPTDVLAFHLHERGEPPLGDVYVGVEQAARQAPGFGATPADEVLRLAAHGTLHVLGWDHPGGEEREGSPMFLRQEALLRGFLQPDR
jgi:probable rRNA maturation factor